jgi:hypothetical protein
MKIQMYVEDIEGNKHVVGRQLDNNSFKDENDESSNDKVLDELVKTFNLLLASCDYNIVVDIDSEDNEEDN